MEDPNVIAYLYPIELNAPAHEAISMSENVGRYFLPQQVVEQQLDNSTRESTFDDANDALPGLRLTFDQGSRTGQGFLLGTDKNCCDIVLPRQAHVSRRHCVLTFDMERRLILRDLSKYGTIVTYDDKGREKRNAFTWILSGSEVLNIKTVVIEIGSTRFRIVVPKHGRDPVHHANVDRLLCEANADEDYLAFNALGIQSTSSTAHQTGVHTPTQGPIYINQNELGRGTFSIVRRVWNVSTGAVYAAKDFLNWNKSDWRREASIMRAVMQLSNDYIVNFITLVETPSPRLILEYLPLGNLGQQHSFSDEDCIAILCQSLDALVSIHEAGIAHRDIKPENILVQSRHPLHIKFADFGLSKAPSDKSELATFCGTAEYLAPEITLAEHAYTEACDIWSLGVVVYECIYGLPDSRKYQAHQWSDHIIKWALDWENDILTDFLTTSMLIKDPKKRHSARKCWEQALHLSNQLSQNRCPTPTQACPTTGNSLKQFSETYRTLSGSVLAAEEVVLGVHAATSTQASKGHLETQAQGRKMKRKKDTPDLAYARSSSSNYQGAILKRTRKGDDFGLLHPRSVNGTDIFGTKRLQGSDAFRPYTTGKHVDEESQQLAQIQGSSRRSKDRVVQTIEEKAAHYIAPVPIVLQKIRLTPESCLICATDLIKASSKRGWPKSSILSPYEVKSFSTEVYVSYVDGLDLASRLKLATKELQAAMKESLRQISIEVCKDEADTTEALIVHILPSRSLISATNLMAVRQQNLSFLRRLMKENAIQCSYNMVKPGTYISYADGLRLCSALGFSEDRLCQIRNALHEGWIGPLIQVQKMPKLDYNVVRVYLARSMMGAPGEFLQSFVQVHHDNLDDRPLDTAVNCLEQSGPDRPRIVLEPSQTLKLEEEFHRNPRASKETILRLANELGIKEKRIVKWFQNRRYKALANRR